MNTRNTMIRVAVCQKREPYSTRFGNTVGLPAPMFNPNHDLNTTSGRESALRKYQSQMESVTDEEEEEEKLSTQ
jgi:hypothetical protein